MFRAPREYTGCDDDRKHSGTRGRVRRSASPLERWLEDSNVRSARASLLVPARVCRLAAKEEAAREEAAREEAAREEEAKEAAAREEAVRERAAREETAGEQAAKEGEARKEEVAREAARGAVVRCVTRVCSVPCARSCQRRAVPLLARSTNEFLSPQFIL